MTLSINHNNKIYKVEAITETGINAFAFYYEDCFDVDCFFDDEFSNDFNVELLAIEC